MRIIAFCGPKTAGKDTAAKYLLARASLIRADLFIQVNFADTLKNVCGQIFGLSEKEMNDPMLKEMPLDRWPFVSPRTLLQNVAKTFRTLYAPDVWVKAWSRKVDHIKAGCIVITDLRHMEEYEKLRELGAKMVYVHNPEVEKIRAAEIEAGDPLWSDASEAFAEFMAKNADVTIENDGKNIDALHTEVHRALLEVHGDWKEWQELSTIDGGIQV